MERFKRAALAATVSKVVALSIALVAMAIWPVAGSAVAAPPATQVITAVPVGPNGEPINGYQEAPSQGNVTAVSECTTPPLSAVGADIYGCHRAPRVRTRVGRRRRDRCCAWTTRGTSACVA